MEMKNMKSLCAGLCFFLVAFTLSATDYTLLTGNWHRNPNPTNTIIEDYSWGSGKYAVNTTLEIDLFSENPTIFLPAIGGPFDIINIEKSDNLAFDIEFYFDRGNFNVIYRFHFLTDDSFWIEVISDANNNTSFVPGVPEYVYYRIAGPGFISNGDRDLFNELLNSNFQSIIRPTGESYYVCTLFIRNQSLYCYYESDAGDSPTIMAYRIIENEISFIIKSNWQINDWNYESEYRPTKYFQIDLIQEGDSFIYECDQLTQLNLSGFQFFPATINNEVVNLRRNPNLDSQVIGIAREGDTIDVQDVTDIRQQILQYDDYWYEIELEGFTGYVYGSLIEFQKILTSGI
jgi:hypothetical protein